MTTESTKWYREPTRAQWLSFGAAWSGWVLDAFDFTIFMLVMPEIARDFGASTIATTGSIALTLIARLVGGVVAGAAADRWGRKWPLMVSIVWFALCDGAVALAPSFGWILVLRTLFGIGMGAEWTSGTTLAMESLPPRTRGIASGILQGSWAVGYLAAAVVSSVVLPIWGWRGLFVVAALPALLVLPMRAWIPDTEASRAPARPVPLRALFAPAILGKLVWASAAMSLGLGAYYALTGLYPTMLKTELGFGDAQVAWLVALFNVGMLVGSVACGALAARRGVATAIVVPALLSIAILPLYVGAQPSLLAVGAFAGGAVGVGFCGVVPMLLTGLVDADIRARFVGIAYHVGALFAALVPMAIAALAKSQGTSLAAALAIVAAACEASLVVVVLARRTARRSSHAAIATAALALVACGVAPEDERVATSAAGLDTVTGFGTNPAGLTMYRYVPAGMPANAPVVVALHGCTQTAAAFANNGLNALADQFKFYVVYPQQSTSNNPVSCFDWWGAYNNPIDKTNITRGKGENLSIKQMVDKMSADFSVDRARVFVVGFSAGGAMASVMLATYPDVFAAGAIDAGIPYDCPSTTNNDVFTCMSPGKTLAASDWGQRVKNAYPGYAGAYPRVTIWQGTQDHTVAVANTTELVKQWTAVHGLSTTPTTSDTVDGYPHSTFADASHIVKVESYAITGMDHGFAVDPAHGCGTAGSYLIDKATCEARHIIDFFGITTAPTSDAGAVDAGADSSVGDASADSSVGDASASDAATGDGSASADGAADASHVADASSHVDASHDAAPGHDSGPGAPSNGADAGDGTASPIGGDAAFAGCTVGAATGRPPFAPLLVAFGLLVARVRRRTVAHRSP